MLPINQIIHNIQFKCLFSLIHCPPVNSRKAAKHLNDMQKEAREMQSHCNVFLRLSDEKLAAHNRAKHEKKKGVYQNRGVSPLPTPNQWTFLPESKRAHNITPNDYSIQKLLVAFILQMLAADEVGPGPDFTGDTIGTRKLLVHGLGKKLSSLI